MHHGDLDFHQTTGRVIDAIAIEGIRIAKQNGWRSLLIDIAAPSQQAATLRCTLSDPSAVGEIDEPSAAMFDLVNELQKIFTSAGTPLMGAKIDWFDEHGDGKIRRRCQFRYD
jgi:hypothetical protein